MQGSELAVPYGFERGVQDVSVGTDHICAVDIKGMLRCWLIEV